MDGNAEYGIPHFFLAGMSSKNSRFRLRHVIFLFLALPLSIALRGQNVSINILTHDAGIVPLNGLLVLEVTINNTSSTDTVASFKLRPQISFPSSLVSLADDGHLLPGGWKLLSAKGGVIRLSNGTDRIAPFDARTLLIKLKGKAVGGPSTISANMMFSNGIAPGFSSGIATDGDLTADNTSTTTCTVVKK